MDSCTIDDITPADIHASGKVRECCCIAYDPIHLLLDDGWQVTESDEEESDDMKSGGCREDMFMTFWTSSSVSLEGPGFRIITIPILQYQQQQQQQS